MLFSFFFIEYKEDQENVNSRNHHQLIMLSALHIAEPKSFTNDELLCRLQKVQNNAARVVSGSKKYDHITPVLKDLHWLPIRKRIEFKILLLTFKCMQGCAPLYLRELLVRQANTRTLRSNTKNLLQIPLTNLKRFGDRAFCAYAPRLWNELPDNIKAADSVQNFKKQLKTLLFRKEFN